MLYNFEAHAELSEKELAPVLEATAPGLEGTASLVIKTKVRVNTELPDAMVETLRGSIAEALSDKFGAETEVSLVSQEH